MIFWSGHVFVAASFFYKKKCGVVSRAVSSRATMSPFTAQRPTLNALFPGAVGSTHGSRNEACARKLAKRIAAIE